jgi:hypothetical protein
MMVRRQAADLWRRAAAGPPLAAEEEDPEVAKLRYAGGCGRPAKQGGERKSGGSARNFLHARHFIKNALADVERSRYGKSMSRCER